MFPSVLSEPACIARKSTPSFAKIRQLLDFSIGCLVPSIGLKPVVQVSALPDRKKNMPKESAWQKENMLSDCCKRNSTDSHSICHVC